jgi:hypothetical protein
MRAKQATCHRCKRRRGFVLLDPVFFVCRALERFGPLLIAIALTCGVAGAATLDLHPSSSVAPVDMMASLRVFTRPRALAMLRYAGPLYGLQVEDVTGIHAGPALGPDKTAIADFRFRYRGCEGKAQAHFIGGDDIEGWWRLRDVADLQHLGEQCGK